MNLDWVAQPAVAWAILALLVVEGAALLALWRARGIGLPPAQTLAFLGAGAAFCVALAAALAGGAPLVLAAALGAAFILHAADLALRWR